MADEMNQEYQHQPTIRVSDFEGPLDLLLHLIKNAEMDIYDIQITEITAQYLEYLHAMQDNQLEVAGEYFVMAATLMAIKSRMLLPIDEDETFVEEEPVEDPRQELVDQLLEYKRYKQAAEQLHEKEQQRQQEFTRSAAAIPDDIKGIKVAPGVSIEQLQEAFVAVMKRKQLAQPVSQTVQTERISISEKLKVVLTAVKKGPTVFEALFEGQTTRDELVTTFLAVLELCKHWAVRVDQQQRLGPLLIVAGPKSKEFEHEQFSTN